MKLEEVLTALRAGEVKGIWRDDWDPSHYWVLRYGILVQVNVATERPTYTRTIIAVHPDKLLDDKWSVVERKPQPVEHAVHIDGPEYARIRDGRQSALVLSSTIYRPGDILMIKDRDTREVLT